MTYKYRGIAYKPETKSLDTPISKTVAKYRGQSYQLSQSLTLRPKTNPNSMNYRGVSYKTTNFDLQVENIAHC